MVTALLALFPTALSPDLGVEKPESTAELCCVLSTGLVKKTDGGRTQFFQLLLCYAFVTPFFSILEGNETSLPQNVSKIAGTTCWRFRACFGS